VLSTLPPGLILILGALVIMAVPRAARGWAFLAFPILALLQLSGLDHGTRVTWDFAIYELVILQVDTLSMVFGWIFALVALVAGSTPCTSGTRGSR